MYSSLAGDEKEFARLFSLGYDSGKRVLEAVLLKKEIPESDLRKTAPMGFMMHAQGPTVDFRVGRIYEASSQYAHDKIVKHDENGLDLPVREWRMDKDLQKSMASNEYRRQNCALLK